VGFVEKERLSGIKHTKVFSTPGNRRGIERGPSVELGDVRAVAYNFIPYRYLLGVLGTSRFLFDSATRARALPRVAPSLARAHLCPGGASR